MNTTDKVKSILLIGDYNKTTLSEELDISRPTLNSRLSGKTDWKKLESNFIKQLHKNEI